MHRFPMHALLRPLSCNIMTSAANHYTRREEEGECGCGSTWRAEKQPTARQSVVYAQMRGLGEILTEQNRCCRAFLSLQKSRTNKNRVTCVSLNTATTIQRCKTNCRVTTKDAIKHAVNEATRAGILFCGCTCGAKHAPYELHERSCFTYVNKYTISHEDDSVIHIFSTVENVHKNKLRMSMRYIIPPGAQIMLEAEANDDNTPHTLPSTDNAR